VAGYVTSAANIDRNAYERTFPYNYPGWFFQQDKPPPPTPLAKMFRVYSIRVWILLIGTISCLSASFLVVFKVERHVFRHNKVSLWSLLTMTYSVLMAENHSSIFKHSPTGFKFLPGVILRQLSNFLSFFNACFFGCMLRAALINPLQPKLIELNHQIATANKPVLYYGSDTVEYEMLLHSGSNLDSWLYHNVDSVFYLNRYQFYYLKSEACGVYKKGSYFM